MKRLTTVKQLRDQLKWYDDEDFIVIETHDETTNDSIDLYDFYIDHIDSVGKNGEREIRLCQIPHSFDKKGQQVIN